jgi:hypothetical protein
MLRFLANELQSKNVEISTFLLQKGDSHFALFYTGDAHLHLNASASVAKVIVTLT